MKNLYIVKRIIPKDMLAILTVAAVCAIVIISVDDFLEGQVK